MPTRSARSAGAGVSSRRPRSSTTSSRSTKVVPPSTCATCRVCATPAITGSRAARPTNEPPADEHQRHDPRSDRRVDAEPRRHGDYADQLPDEGTALVPLARGAACRSAMPGPAPHPRLEAGARAAGEVGPHGRRLRHGRADVLQILRGAGLLLRHRRRDPLVGPLPGPPQGTPHLRGGGAAARFGRDVHLQG